MLAAMLVLGKGATRPLVIGTPLTVVVKSWGFCFCVVRRRGPQHTGILACMVRSLLPSILTWHFSCSWLGLQLSAPASHPVRTMPRDSTVA